ncbi:fimbria/pilus outer membrane usher protein [Escherichia coli]|uniref:fimbria/pilus outer membrane usher protein n=1 Tax=Escherichia coli TaxID=562 RepID=UPI0010CC5468|nr:fimbria/pilus outer membrane usher protein [Escherichia coli]GCR40521.1 fimbrial usher protein [Escherichia coli]
MIMAKRASHLKLIFSLFFICGSSWADKLTFDPSLFNDATDNGDKISLFEHGGQLPGDYLVDVFLGDRKVDSAKIQFYSTELPNGEYILKSCLTKEQLSRYGVNVAKFSGLSTESVKDAQSNKQCASLSAIPQATESFDFYNMRLTLNIPQVALRPKDEIDIERWNDGIPAFLFNYMANSSIITDRKTGKSQSSHYIQAYPGLNIGAWRIRHSASWSKRNGARDKWENSYIYATRGLYRLKSRINFGQIYTTGDFFDSIPFSGVSLSDDESMLQDGQNGFMPVVRGIARSQARVEIRQDDYLIYSAVVSPGAFEFSDINPRGASGELHVTVLESSGARQNFIVPYSTPSIALRKGHLRYAIAAGHYHPANGNATVPISQATMAYGLPWDFTVFLGGQRASHYGALSTGAGANLGDFGALSSGITISSSEDSQQRAVKGDMWRVEYNKTLQSSSTTILLKNEKYGVGFKKLSEALDSYHHNNQHQRRNYSLCNQTTGGVSQMLHSFGHLGLNWSRWTYRGAPARTFWGGAYSFNTGDIFWTLNFNNSNNDRLFNFSVSIPLGQSHKMYTGYRMASSKESKDHELSLRGQAFDERLDWDIRQKQHYAQSRKGVNNGSLGLGWHGNNGYLGGNYYYDINSHQFDISTSGGMVGHQHGLTLGPEINGSTALIELPGFSGVPIQNAPWIKTDFRGYALMPGLAPYQEQSISLDSEDLPLDIEINQGDVKVLPTDGAIVRAKFSLLDGVRSLMTIERTNGKTIPFGAIATLISHPTNTAIVDEEGKIYMSGLPENGELLVQWGKNIDQQCKVSYRISNGKRDDIGIYMLKEVCH